MTEKYAKGPGTAKTVATAFRSCRYGEHSTGSCFSQTTFRSVIGDKRTRFPRDNSNADIHRSNSFYPVSAVWTVVCCVLDSAGGFRELPVREKRPRTCHPERSEGSQTIVGKAKNLKTQDFYAKQQSLQE
jgi:hypothetical protein